MALVSNAPLANSRPRYNLIYRKDKKVGVMSRFLAVLFLAGTSVLAQKQTESSVKTFNAAEGAREAEKLLARVFSERPEQTFTNALLRIREREGDERKIVVRLQTS